MITKPVILSIISCVGLILIFAVIGCGTSAPAVPASQAVTPSQTSPVPSVVPPLNNPVQPSVTASATPAAVDLKTVTIYFYMNQRCVTCLCFEKQINYVMGTFYETEKNNGKLTYQVLNAQEKQNADIAKKYSAVSSSFFVNTIVNGVDHIKDIQAIWDWNCRGDTAGFNKKIKAVVDASLKGQY
jgi:hypothetical protein